MTNQEEMKKTINTKVYFSIEYHLTREMEIVLKQKLNCSRRKLVSITMEEIAKNFNFSKNSVFDTIFSVFDKKFLNLAN